MTGAFALWQPEYAARGVATFPVRDKRPAVGNYQRMGRNASEKLVKRFANDDAFGVSSRRANLTVVDVDAPDENLLADCLTEYGETPFIVRTPSGFHAWYRNNGEGRAIRPNPDKPVDILGGDGFVVAPHSIVAKGTYELVSGSLDDLANLPTMLAREVPSASEKVAEGGRAVALFKECLRVAADCTSNEALISYAVERNAAMFTVPLPNSEALKAANDAWQYQTSGRNWFGRRGHVTASKDEVTGLMIENQKAFLLLMLLRQRHWGHPTFQVPNDLHELFGWSRPMFAKARQRLVDDGTLVEVRPASTFHGPSIYRFNKGVSN